MLSMAGVSTEKATLFFLPDVGDSPDARVGEIRGDGSAMEEFESFCEKGRLRRRGRN